MTQQVLRAWDRGPRGLDPFYGLGLVDAAAALGAATQAPAAQPAGDANEPLARPRHAQRERTDGTVHALRVEAVAADHRVTVRQPPAAPP